MDESLTVPVASHAIVARIERLPASRSLLWVVILIAVGGWFEFYELFMPSAISLGMVHDGIFTVRAQGLLDLRSFPSFLASFFLGMFLSTLIFGRVSDLFGRRVVFIWSMAIYSVFQLLIATSSSPLWIDLFRLMAGLAVGMQLINNDSFQAEITPRRLRGRYMSISYAFILTAVPISAFLGALLVPYVPLGVSGWRWVVIISALGGVLVWMVQRGLPESPRWLEAHGRFVEADRALRQIEAKITAELGSLPPPDVAMAEPPATPGHWKDMFGARYLPRTIALSVFQFLQTVAVFGFTSWVPILLVERGYTVLRSLEYTFLMLLLTPMGGIVAAYFAERVERKWQLVLTAGGIGVFGFAFAFSSNIGLIVSSGALVTLSNNWLISVFHPYAAELYPTRIRAQALGFCFSWSRASAIFVGFGVSAILANWGEIGVFVMIGVAMLLIVLSIGIFGPRTNGRSLEDLSP